MNFFRTPALLLVLLLAANCEEDWQLVTYEGIAESSFFMTAQLSGTSSRDASVDVSHRQNVMNVKIDNDTYRVEEQPDGTYKSVTEGQQMITSMVFDGDSLHVVLYDRTTLCCWVITNYKVSK